MLEQMHDTAQVLDQAPLAIEAAMATGSPALVMSDIEEVLSRMRSEGMSSVFASEDELKKFYRIMSERLLARMLHLTEETLIRVADTLGTGQHSLRSLSLILDSLTRHESALANAIRHAADNAPRAVPTSDDDLRAAVMATESKVKQLTHGAPE